MLIVLMAYVEERMDQTFLVLAAVIGAYVACHFPDCESTVIT